MNVQKVLVKKCGTLSMGDIDKVDYKLGSIEATQALILKSLHTIEDAYKETRDKTILHGSSLETLWKWKDTTAQPLLNEYETNRDKGKGAWKTLCMVGAAISAIGGIVGGIIAKALGFH